MSVLYLRVYPCLRSLIRSSQELFLFIALRYIKTTFPLFSRIRKSFRGGNHIYPQEEVFSGSLCLDMVAKYRPTFYMCGTNHFVQVIQLTTSSSYNTIGATYTVYLVETIYCSILVMGHTVHLGSLHSTLGADHTIHFGTY
jgi:hypothetical protein